MDAEQSLINITVAHRHTTFGALIPALCTLHTTFSHTFLLCYPCKKNNEEE